MCVCLCVENVESNDTTRECWSTRKERFSQIYEKKSSLLTMKLIAQNQNRCALCSNRDGLMQDFEKLRLICFE